MANAINWFEIPAINFQRAKDFYSKIFDAELHVQNIMEYQMAFFPSDQNETSVGGAICKGEGYVPSATGTLPYLNGGEDLSEMLGRINAAGGNVVLPKTKISDEIGFYAIFMDTEGNKIALHSPK